MCVLWVLWDERNGRVLRDVKRESDGLWSLVCFHVSYWASTLKIFCNCSMNLILYSLVSSKSKAHSKVTSVQIA